MNFVVLIKGSMGNLPQGDEAFIEFLEQLGVSVTINDNEIKKLSPKKLKGPLAEVYEKALSSL